MIFVRVILAAALSVALGAGPAMAQLLPSQKGAEAPAGGGSSRTVSTGGGIAGCYNVFVTVPGEWDPWPGKRGNVDPVIIEQTTGARTACVDSPNCSLRVEGAGAQMSFVIEDDDPDASDPIGSGSCRSGRSCQVGAASITMSAC
jgi:hypothetical protein